MEVLIWKERNLEMKMNRPMLRKIVLSVVLILFLSSCRKYDENTLWLKKPEKIFFGAKIVNNYFIDGVDKTNDINEHIDDISFVKDDEHPNSNDFVVNLDKSLDTTYTYTGVVVGLWELNNDKNKITFRQLNFTPVDSVVDIFLYEQTEWNIIKLKKNDIKLETTVNNHYYQMELIQEP